MDDVDPGGVADMAGIRKGDFLLEVNTYQTALSQSGQNLYENAIQIVMAIFKPKPMTPKPESFYKIKYGSSIVTSKASQKISVMKT